MKLLQHKSAVLLFEDRQVIGTIKRTWLGAQLFHAKKVVQKQKDISESDFLAHWPQHCGPHINPDADIEVILGSDLCFLDVLPWGELTSPQTPQSIDAINQRTVNSPTAKTPPQEFRSLIQGRHIYSASVRRETLTQITSAAAQKGWKLASVRPMISWLSTGFARALPRKTGWILIDEPGIMSVGRVEGGHLSHLQARRIDKQQPENPVTSLNRAAKAANIPPGEVTTILLHRPLPAIDTPWVVTDKTHKYLRMPFHF